MEFCENNTLRDLVDQGSLYKDKARIWQLFKEMVEGLVHVHKQVRNEKKRETVLFYSRLLNQENHPSRLEAAEYFSQCLWSR